MSDVLIRGVRLYGEGDQVDVLVSDGQIADVGSGLAVPDDADVVDAYVGCLRRELDRLGPPLIVTHRGFGYALRTSLP